MLSLVKQRGYLNIYRALRVKTMSYYDRSIDSTNRSRSKNKLVNPHMNYFAAGSSLGSKHHCGRYHVWNVMDARQYRCISSLMGINISLASTGTKPIIPKSYHHTKCNCNSSDNPKSRKCWKCGGDTNPKNELFFCECGVVQQPADELSFFDLFQIEQGFDIDLSSLGRQYRETQNRLHPDKFSTKSQEEQAFAEIQSALLNKAYTTLLKPLSRAIYMLELVNITIEENDSYSDPEFLMDIMTVNEAITTASTSEEIDALEETNQQKVNECINHISKAFKKSNVVEAKNVTIKLRYFTTIQERIKELRIKNLG